MSDRILIKSVEYPITEHCNLSCAHCDHASPLLDEKFADLDQYRRDVRELARVVHAKDFLVIGGEPLLHPDLLDMLEFARVSNIANRITLVSNGTLLHRAEPRMWELIDRLWLSVYPKIGSRIDLDGVARLCAEHHVLLDKRDIDVFRQTLTSTRIDDPEVVQTIYDRCALAHRWRCYSLYAGRFYKCSPAPFMKARLQLRGIDFRDDDDGVIVDSDPSLGDRLQQYLTSDRPLASCAYCLGSSGPSTAHRQLNAREVLQVIRRDDPPVDRLIDLTRLAEEPVWRQLRAPYTMAEPAHAE